MKLEIILPAYNEENGLKHTFDTIPFDDIKNMGYDVSILVVDNNSTDNTEKVAKKYGCKLVKEFNKGYGYAYKKGFKTTIADIIVTGDADGTYPFYKLPEMLKVFKEENLDLMLTNRFANGYKNISSMKLLNKAGNWLLSFVLRLLYGLRINDSQSGMWIIKKDLLDKLKIKSNGMGLSFELKIEAVYYNKAKWLEYPIPYHERIGKAKLNLFEDGLKNLYEMFLKRYSR